MNHKSYKTKEEAQQEAEKHLHIVKCQLYGDWKIDIMDSLGWHFVLHLGTMSLTCGDNSYNCMISDDEESIGCVKPDWCNEDSFATPKEAVNNALEFIADSIAAEIAIIDKNRKLLLPRKQHLNILFTILRVLEISIANAE